MGGSSSPKAVASIEVAAALPQLTSLDPRSDPAMTALATALAAAAREAAATGSRLRGAEERDELKRRIDGAATAAAEAVFDAERIAITVVAGEGQRDSSPGAAVGQNLGRRDDAPLDGIFDYVDGTSLVADGLRGALALGGLGRGLRVVPDLQALAVIGPGDIVDGIDVMADPEEAAVGWVEAIGRGLGRRTADLTIATHSTTSSRSHVTLIERMRGTGARVIVPDPVTIEPPFVLSAIGLAEPKVDAFIGVIGLSEIAFAALLLDLVLPGHRIVFRLASIDGARAAHDDRLDGHFRFSKEELATYAEHGWDIEVAHTSDEVVPRGAGHSAALFAVTENDMMGLPAPVFEDGTAVVEGLVTGPGAAVGRVRIAFVN